MAIELHTVKTEHSDICGTVVNITRAGSDVHYPLL